MLDSFYETVADNGDYFKVMTTENNCTAAHFHNCTEIIAVLEGRERVGINGVERILGAGEFGVSNSLDIHYYEPEEHSRVSVIMLSAEYTAHFRESGKKLDNFLPRGPRSEELLSLVEKLSSLEGHSRLVVTGYVDVLLGSLAETYPAGPSKERETGRVAEILQYLDEHFSEKLTLVSVAARFGYSPTYFSALFNRFTGMHFKDYLNRLRIQRARVFSEGRPFKLRELLDACGFESANTYYRAKKRWETS